MKQFLWIIITLLLSFNVKGQSFEYVATSDLHQVAINFGLDSALNRARGLPLYIIDEKAAVELLGLMGEYRRYTRSGSFFTNMAHNWENSSVKEKTANFMNDEFKKIIESQPDRNGNIHEFDDQLLLSVLKQRPDSAEEKLILTYEACVAKCDSLKKQFAPFLKRFFSFFTYGTHPTVIAYKDCQMNCYKIMWALKQLESSYFNQKKMDYHNSKLQQWRMNYNIHRFMDTYKEYDEKIFQLNTNYATLNEIDFENEQELKRFPFFSSYKHNWNIFMLYNKNNGFLIITDLLDRSVYRVEYRLQLTKNNNLKMITINEFL